VWARRRGPSARRGSPQPVSSGAGTDREVSRARGTRRADRLRHRTGLRGDHAVRFAAPQDHLPRERPFGGAHATRGGPQRNGHPRMRHQPGLPPRARPARGRACRALLHDLDRGAPGRVERQSAARWAPRSAQRRRSCDPPLDESGRRDGWIAPSTRRTLRPTTAGPAIPRRRTETGPAGGGRGPTWAVHPQWGGHRPRPFASRTGGRRVPSRVPTGGAYACWRPWRERWSRCARAPDSG
jgi:hypothetical protein